MGYKDKNRGLYKDYKPLYDLLSTRWHIAGKNSTRFAIKLSSRNNSRTLPGEILSD